MASLQWEVKDVLYETTNALGFVQWSYVLRRRNRYRYLGILDWATAGGSLSEGSVSPIKDSNGAGLLCFGLIVCLLSAFLLRGKRKRWVGLTIIICGAFSIFLVLFSLIDITNTSEQISEKLNL